MAGLWTLLQTANDQDAGRPADIAAAAAAVPPRVIRNEIITRAENRNKPFVCMPVEHTGSWVFDVCVRDANV